MSSPTFQVVFFCHNLSFRYIAQSMEPQNSAYDPAYTYMHIFKSQRLEILFQGWVGGGSDGHIMIAGPRSRPTDYLCKSSKATPRHAGVLKEDISLYLRVAGLVRALGHLHTL